MIYRTGLWTTRQLFTLCLILCFTVLPNVFGSNGAVHVRQKDLFWAGRGNYRILVKVEPASIGQRSSDQMPAEIIIDFKDQVSRQLGIEGRLDVSSIQVIRYDPQSGKPVPFGKYAYATSRWDCPFRWYDDAIPYNFPDYHRPIAPTKGEIRDWNYVPKWGHLFGTQGDWKEGHLAWVHTQTGSKASHYAIYFDVLPKGTEPSTIPPAGFLGDAMERREPVGHNTTDLLDARLAIDDWNNDGLFDMVVGSARGTILWYPNIGTKTEPKFVYSKLVFTTDGKPLDVGISSEPLVVDWDGDGVKDLLVGANSNRMIFFKNIGSNIDRKFVNRGFVLAGDKPIILPHEPVPGGKGVFDDDYHPVPEVVDWDGDGDSDLLMGGYVTGRIFLYERVGRSADGTPALKDRGPLMADGEILDVEWCASPTVADFDGDGDLDLVTGTLRYTSEEGDPSERELFLRYFENVGTREKPVLKRIPFPKKGAFPSGPLVTPRAVDFNNDGLIDLAVSALDDIWLYENIGTKSAPIFDVSSKPLPSQWGNAFIADISSQLIDWNSDGLIDIVTSNHVRLNEGKGWPNIFSEPQPILGPGEVISHPAPMGDNYSFNRIGDLDKDGKLDILVGDHAGNIYFHKNLSTPNTKHFDTVGIKLMMADGKPIKVGPKEGAKIDFQVLQGARTTLDIADFNRDGKPDLVIGDTYGVVRYYENLSTGKEFVFSDPVQIGDMHHRMSPCAADWDGDGFPDVFGVDVNGRIELYMNRGSKNGKAEFLPGKELKAPPEPYWTAVNVADWNGDGDNDLLIATDYLYFTWVEKSYLENGYAAAKIEGAPESRLRTSVKMPKGSK